MAKKVKQVFVQESQCEAASFSRRRGPTSHWSISTQAPQKGEEEDRQGAFFLPPSDASTRHACSRLERSIAAGARHDRVPQVSRVVVLQLGEIPAQKSTSRRPRLLTSLLAQGKAASPEKLKHEAAVAALTAQIQLIELEASQRDPLF